ncbi:MAG: VIT1/CCC1 transporter family protein, partial [Candidatus Omnitrophota bacterium]
KELQQLIDNWHIEKDAALLYRTVARFEHDEKRKRIFHNLSRFEEEHAGLWEKELKGHGGAVPHFKPRFKTKITLFLIQRLGRRALIDVLERNKQSKIRGYFNQLELFASEALRERIKELFAIEKKHATVLQYLNGKEISPFGGGEFHREGGGIRDIIFGMNDGLLSTFSLVAGVAGGTMSNNVILLAGLAGAIAGAISMAAGAFVSTRAEREVMELQLKIEKKELELMPESEQKELAHLYQRKGIDREQAERIAHTIMQDKDIALDTMAREELGFSPSLMVDPFKAALFSGIFFIIGAAVPIVPFFILYETYAFPAAIICSLSCFFVIGASRTIITGKKALQSGMEMFFIGSGAAAITYVIGTGIGNIIK